MLPGAPSLVGGQLRRVSVGLGRGSGPGVLERPDAGRRGVWETRAGRGLHGAGRAAALGEPGSGARLSVLRAGHHAQRRALPPELI